jgi:large subunit ribosomal protein L21
VRFFRRASFWNDRSPDIFPTRIFNRHYAEGAAGMYAVIKTGGKQYKVAEGDTIRIEKLSAEVGDTVTFDDVKLVAKEKGAIIDPKELESVKVEGTVLAQEKAKKIIVLKFKRRKGYKRKQGHRQRVTKLQITKIKA